MGRELKFGKRVYVAGPYSGNSVLAVLDNISQARRAAPLVARAGWAPFCPHYDSDWSAHMTKAEHAAMSVDVYKAFSMAYVEVADVVLLLPGWENSGGTLAEKARAVELGIPCVELPQDVLDGEDVERLHDILWNASGVTSDEWTSLLTS